MSSRSRSFSHALAAALAALTVLTALATPAAADQTRSLEKSFPLTSGATLRLGNLAGAVELTAGDGDAVRVEATLHAEGRDAEETGKLLAALEWVQGRDAKGNDAWLLSYPVKDYDSFHYPRPGEIGSWFGSSSSVHYLGERVSVVSHRSGSAPTLYADLRITVPRQSDLVVENAVGKVHGGELAGTLGLDCASGDVDLGGFDGKLEVDTGSGDVRVGRLTGAGSFDTGSGDVSVGEEGGLNGSKVAVDTGSGDVQLGGGKLDQVVVKTGSGDVRVSDLDAAGIDLNTGSGDVTLRSPLAVATRVKVDTGSGDVEIYGGPDASFKLAADQGSGKLDVRYGDARLIRSGREVVGAERGDGRTRIDIDTGSGDCVVAPSR
jgi:Toastrack DUF4097